MSNLEVWLIIILVIGVIASNIAVLKYSAKFKLPQFGNENKPKSAPKGDQASKSEQGANGGQATEATPETDKGSQTKPHDK